MPEKSTHKNIAEAVADSIAAIGIRDYPNNHPITRKRVLVRWGIEVDPVELPAIFVVPTGTESVVGGTNERDDVSYPIGVYIVDRQSQLAHKAIDDALYWRQQIRRRFVAQRLGTYAFNCFYESSPVQDAEWLREYEMVVEPLFFRFIAREARG